MPIKWDKLRSDKLIQGLYRQLFGREPEGENLRGLSTYFVEGRISVRMQLARMLKSDEFFDKRLRGKSEEDIAKELYRIVLARPPESPAALQAAADVVGGLTWRTQVDIMLNSEEYLSRFGDDGIPVPGLVV